MMFKLAVFLGIPYFYSFTIVNGDDNCCCCELSEYYEVNRVWTTSDECESPKKCCNIPSQYECELQLNPTFDGSCGHVDESSYQLRNGGTSSVSIPRNGYSSSEEIKGWFGERLMDSNGNEIQEWCFDNGENDSFFLFRWVPCNGDYPSWFARCVWPSANNMLLYAGCDDDDYTQNGCNYDEFSSTIPSCFGEIEEINIGEGDDSGRAVAYRLLPEQKHEWMWCTKNGEPQDPPTSGTDKNYLMYNGNELTKGDGITPFYLEECREVVKLTSDTSDTSNSVDHAAPLILSDSSDDDNNMNVNDSITGVSKMNKMNKMNEMKSLSFGVSIDMVYDNKQNWTILVETNKYFKLINNNYLTKGDSFSIKLKDVNVSDIIKVFTPKNWNYKIKSILNDNNNNNDLEDTYITFINDYEGEFDLSISNKLYGFGFVTKENVNIVKAAWIARSVKKKGPFTGFGKIDLV